MSNTIFAKLNRTVQAEDGDFFKKESVIEILTPPDKEGAVEIVPVAAYDTSGNPYPETDHHVYSMVLCKSDYTEVPPTKKLSFAFGTPGFDFEASEKEDDSVSLALKEVYDPKGWVVDSNGYILEKRSGIRQFQIIAMDKVQTDEDVVNWVHEKIAQRLNHDTIRQVATNYFDDDWNNLVEAELKKVSEDISDEDKSMTEKAPAKEYLDKYPNKENTKEQKYPIVEAKKIRLQAIRDKMKLKKKAGEPEEFSYTEKVPDGTNKKQLGDYPDPSDEKTHPMKTEAITVKSLLNRISNLRTKYKLAV